MDIHTRSGDITLRVPTATDGGALHRLVADCSPLDTNSRYCNLLQCYHFADTAVIAEWRDNSECPPTLAGAVTGYRLPAQPSVLFVWQVAVHPRARGLGVSKAMLGELIARCSPRGVTHLHTTITATNDASWALFRAVANTLDAPLTSELAFGEAQHFEGVHDSEYWVRIGPFSPISPRATRAVADSYSSSKTGAPA